MLNVTMSQRQLLFFFFFISASVRAAESVDLSAALRAAANFHESAKLQQFKLAKTRASQDQAMASIMPRLSASAGVAAEDKANASDEWSREELKKSAKLSATQPLLEWLRYRDAAAALNAQLRSDESASLQAMRDLEIAVVKAFYAVLVVDSDRSSFEELRQTNLERVKDLRQRVRIGRSRQADLFAAQAQLASAEAQISAAMIARADAWRRLTDWTGLGPDVKLTDSVDLPSEPKSPESYLSQIADDPQIKALQAATEAADASIKSIRSGHLPELDLAANYHLYREKPQDRSKWDVVLQLTLPLYDGGTVSSQVQQAIITKDEAATRQSEGQRLLMSRLASLYQSLVAQMSQLQSLKSAYELSQKSHAQIARDYAVGLASNSEVIQSLNTFTESSRLYHRQILQSKATYAELQLSTGVSL